MAHSGKCLLLLVRSDDDIPRACREAGEFLAFRDARVPKVHEEPDEEFVGIWVDPLAVDSPPDMLGRSSASGHRAFQTRGSLGLGGIWLLCWLDAADGGSPAEHGSLRESLVSALVEQRTRQGHHATPKFAPIYDAADGLPHVCLRTERLRLSFGNVIGASLTWNRTTGALGRADKFEPSEAGSE